MFCVIDDAAGNLLQLLQGKMLLRARGHVNVAAASRGIVGRSEDLVIGGPEAVDIFFPILVCAEDW